MQKTTLGTTGLEVTPICFGTWQLGGEWGTYDEDQAIEAIRAGRRLGINFFDTAQAYGFGVSERILGRALAAELRANRDAIVLSTKGGLRSDGDQVVPDSSPEWLARGIDESLNALGVDHIDLYQVHVPDPDTPFEKTARALEELVHQGKIRYVGVSNFSVGQIAAFGRTRPVEVVQPVYHLFHRQIEDELLPYCQEHDIGVHVYGPLAHGLLTGTLDERTKFADDDWRSVSPTFRGRDYVRNLGVVRELAEFATERGYDVTHLAIAWTLANPTVDTAIVGTRNANHIGTAVEAADIALTNEDLAEIDRIMMAAAEVPDP
jgi:aryl-alcohol dehydrogenase-like predicted oxidoreductase